MDSPPPPSPFPPLDPPPICEMCVNEILSGPFIQYQVPIRAIYSRGLTACLRNVVPGKRITLPAESSLAGVYMKK